MTGQRPGRPRRIGKARAGADVLSAEPTDQSFQEGGLTAEQVRATGDVQP